MTTLGSTSEADEYRRWAATRGFQVELTALILAERHGATGMTGHPVPNGDDYRAAAQIVDTLNAQG